MENLAATLVRKTVLLEVHSRIYTTELRDKVYPIIQLAMKLCHDLNLAKKIKKCPL